MADRETTPPPAAAAAVQSPMTPAAKRVRTTSPPRAATSEVLNQAEETTPATAASTEGSSENDDLEADDGLDTDSAFGTDVSDSTSLSSSIYAGYVENGRRYQTKREGEYWGPSDEKQFESLEALHILHLILDSRHENPLFYSPIAETAQNILDIGTGTGRWCVDVADRYPSALVQGVDLYPPPHNWAPPNCRLEVDDVLKPWMFNENGRFDLVHMRYMLGSFSDEQWRLVYKQAYNNLAPGGWIEQLEPNVTLLCDDGTAPADSFLSGWGPIFHGCGARSGRRLDTTDTMRSAIEAAGFVNVQEKNQKAPLGEWAKSPLMKEAGKFNKLQMLAGMEGYALFLLTHFGAPTPWSAEEVQVYLAKVRNEIHAGKYHTYFPIKRVWAQKPYETKA